MRILVMEDEYLVAESLIKLLKILAPDAEIAGPVATVEEARKMLPEHRPDLVIADIQLADGVSLDIFAAAEYQYPVIFTTAFNEYAIRAFKVNSIDYLLKPIDKTELKAALDKFQQIKSKFKNGEYLKELSSLLHNFRNADKYKERFAVHSGRNIILVPNAEIAAFVKEEIIFLMNHEGRKFVTDYRSLDEIQELIDPAVFFRANRQYIIHLPFIASMHTDEAAKICVKLKLPASPDVIISKEKAVLFRRWIEG